MYSSKNQKYEARATIISDKKAFTAFRRTQNPKFTAADDDHAWQFFMSSRHDLEEKFLFNVTKHYVDGWRWAPRWDALFAKEQIISRNGPCITYPIPASLGVEAEKHQQIHKKRLDSVLTGDLALMAIYAENYFYATLAQEHLARTGEDRYAAFRETAHELMSETEDDLLSIGVGIVPDLDESLRKSVAHLRDTGHLKI